MTDLDDLIARLRAATEGTTPGPWTIKRNDHGDLIMWAGDNPIMGNPCYDDWTPDETDWPFIAAARQLVPEAAAALEALRDEVARWKALAVDRDGGSHDEDCSSRMERGRPCTCGHDAIRAALKHQ